MIGNSSSAKQEQVTVVAEAQFGIALALMLFLLAPVIGWAIVSPSLTGNALGAACVTMTVFAVFRLRVMRLAVDGSSVEVANFFTTHRLELASIEIETADSASLWPADDIPASQRQPTVGDDAPDLGQLILSDRSGQQVKVGVVPSYGDRRAEIVNDLRAAIENHRGY